MTNGRVEVITSVERRRRWNLAEKQQVVAASLEPGVSVTAITRRRLTPTNADSCRIRAARRTGQADFPHPALGQNFTPSPTARRAQGGNSGVGNPRWRKSAWLRH
jgi:transposase